MVITEPAVPSARPLSLGLKLYPSNKQYIKLDSVFLDYAKVEQVKKKAPLAGWLIIKYFAKLDLLLH